MILRSWFRRFAKKKKSSNIAHNHSGRVPRWRNCHVGRKGLFSKVQGYHSAVYEGELEVRLGDESSRVNEHID